MPWNGSKLTLEKTEVFVMFENFNLLDLIIQTYYIILPIICTAAVRKVSKSLEAQEQKAGAVCPMIPSSRNQSFTLRPLPSSKM